MKTVLRIFGLVHAFMAVLFACSAVMLVVIATRTGWLAFTGSLQPMLDHGATANRRSTAG